MLQFTDIFILHLWPKRPDVESKRLFTHFYKYISRSKRIALGLHVKIWLYIGGTKCFFTSCSMRKKFLKTFNTCVSVSVDQILIETLKWTTWLQVILNACMIYLLIQTLLSWHWLGRKCKISRYSSWKHVFKVLFFRKFSWQEVTFCDRILWLSPMLFKLIWCH